MYLEETAQQRSARIRNGRLAMLASIGWWVLSIGGIILVINLNQ